MDSPLARFLAASGCGVLQDTVALREAISLPGGGEAPAWLCTTDRGLFIAGVAGEPGASFDLGRATSLRYQRRPIGNRLIVDGQTFTLPIGAGERVRGQLALARLSATAPHPGGTPPPASAFVQPGEPEEEHWLSGALPREDPVIAWLPTASEHTFSESIGGRTDAPLRFLLTASAAMLVAVSRYGEVHTRPLTAAPILLTDNRLSRDEATLGEQTWRLPRGGLEVLTPLHALPAMSRDRRLRAAARLRALRDEEAGAVTFLTELAAPDPLDALSLAVLRRSASARKAAVAALIQTDSDAGRLTLWTRQWQLPLTEARALLGVVLSALPPTSAAWAIPLHRQVRDLQLAAETDPFAQASIDLELAEHLILCDRRAEAVAVLESRWEKLPDEDLRAVLPPPGADLTSGEGGPELHIRTLELLAIARGPNTTPDLAAVAALARHLPLVPARLDALAALDDPVLSPRAAAAQALLAPGGLARLPAADLPPARPLALEQVEAVRHPVARESGTMGWIQSALARVTPPDQGSLQDFCEQVSPRRHPAVLDAISAAAVALGVPAVPAFISMGKKRIGVRSHERPEPFLLIGGDHLDPDSDVHLSPAELRAVIAAEIAHLRFGHSRITSTDVWAGVWDKSTTAIGAATVVLPFMKYIPVDLIGKQRTYETIARVMPTTWLQQIYQVEDAVDLADAVTDNIGRIGEAAGSLAGTASGHLDTAAQTYDKLLPKAAETDVGLESAQILAAHRTMQLTADRAGLLLSGDLIASVRAMCLVHSRLASELAVAERVGLRSALARRGPDGAPILPELTLRIAALIAFYLSEEYTTLAAAVRQEG